jgi:NADP-dependent 3-hydroxy acid dehydrogenase YdfG
MISAGTDQRSGLLDASLEEWKTVLRVNLTGRCLGTQAAVLLLMMMQDGSVINIASSAGNPGYRRPTYAAST